MLKNTVWVFFALILSSTVTVAQNKNGRNNAETNTGRSIINQVSGLSEKQVEMIGQVENGYRLTMNDLRTRLQATANVSEKSALRTEMQKVSQSHQTTIKRLLTPDQQKEYNKLLAENRPGTPRPQAKGQGRGQGKGSGRGRRMQ